MGILLFLIGMLLFLSGCNSIRYLPKDKLLLNKVELKLDNSDIDKKDLIGYVRQKPNTKMLGIWKFRLWLYNLSKKSRTDDLFKRIGEAPVVYDEQQRQRARDNMLSYLKNKGYYDARIFDKVEISRSGRKVNLIYQVFAGKPYMIKNLFWDIKDRQIKDNEAILEKNSLVKPGMDFDVDQLDAERQRITIQLKNLGYYKFGEESVSFVADSTAEKKKIDLTVVIEQPEVKIVSKDTVKHNHSVYLLNDFYIYPDFEQQKAVEDSSYSKEPYDTLSIGRYHFLTKGGNKIKPQAILNTIRMKSGELYMLGNVERTYNSLVAIRQFRQINIFFEEVDKGDSLERKKLNCYIQLTPQTLQSYTFDVEGTNSSGNYGFAGNLNYQHRNIFKGAELLNVKFKGALEKQVAVVNNANQKFNTREYGVETDLLLPRFWSFLKEESFSKYAIPETRFSLSYNYQKRPDYTRTIANAQFGYDWKTSAFSKHQLNVIDFNVVHLFSMNKAFLDSIKNLYIRSSYIDHLILGSNYTYIYNTQNLQKKTNYDYFRLSFESAGNLLWLIKKLDRARKVAQNDDGAISNYYRIMNTPFAQYMKLDLEYRHGYILDPNNSLIFRTFVGVGVPMGNFGLLPFEKQYFTGGADGIRAWKVRSLGPGTYNAPASAFPNQSSDMKLEGNAEYRFKMFWKLEGAFFIDAGNIWAINSKDNRSGAQFRLDEFYKQIAIGTGYGIRIDFSYFILRLDLGVKVRDPSEPAGSEWRVLHSPLGQDNLNLTFAIGYPF